MAHWQLVVRLVGQRVVLLLELVLSEHQGFLRYSLLLRLLRLRLRVLRQSLPQRRFLRLSWHSQG
jgi:hypothetical protein